MNSNVFTLYPARRYMIKLYVSAIIPLLFLSLLVVQPIVDKLLRWSGIAVGPVITAGIVCVIMLAIVSVVVNAYYRSIWYQIRPDEVIVGMGIITKRVTHVPFRTITNLDVTRGPLDRLLGIGALSIQTAGASGTTRPEESLVGMRDVQEVYEYIAGELRRFRGAMSPTQAENEGAPGLTYANRNEEVLNAILYELRAIRSELGQANR